MRLLAAAAIGLAWAGTTGATPNSVPFEDCTSSQTLAESRYNPAEQINVTSVYAQIADVGDGHGEQLRLSFLAQMGKELVGFSNTTNYSTTLIYTTSIATFTVFTNRTFFCLNAVPPAPTPPQPYTDTSCVIPAGELAFAKELACIDVGVTPIEDTGVGGSFDVAGVLFWTSVGLAIGYWVVVGAARIAAAWRRGSWDSNQRWVYIRWAGTVLASAISGERLAASPALLRFATPSMRDIIFHTQWCACLAMVAVEWPMFVYPILSNTAWAHLLYNVTIIQGADSNLEHWWPLRTPLYDPPSTFSDQLANKSSPLYIDASAPNTLFTFPSYPTDTARGIPALAAAVGLREQDLFGMCVTTFLVIVGSALVVSVFIWAVDWLISSVVNGGRSGATRGVRGPVVVNPANASGPADRDVKDVHFATGRSPSPESQLFPTATRGLGGGHARRGWWRYRLGQSSFHGSVLHGNLVRLLLLFHLPVTIFSCYQFTLGRSTATKLSVILASLTFAVFSVSIPMFLIYRVMRTPTGKLYDATRTLLSLGPLYNHYGHGSQLFAGLFFANNIAVGSVIGAGQKSGTAQSIIILVIEVASALATSIWLPWGKGAHMSAVSFLFCVLRIIGSVLLVILSPAVAIGDSAGAWIAFAILIIIAIIYVMFHPSYSRQWTDGRTWPGWMLRSPSTASSLAWTSVQAFGQSVWQLKFQGWVDRPSAFDWIRLPQCGRIGLYFWKRKRNELSTGPSNVVPAPQSYLRPEQAWQPYREADDDEGGYIMQSWHQQPHNNAQPGYPTAQQGGYQAVPTQPPPASTSGSSGFSRVKGGRAHYDSPFAIRTPARPSPLSSQVHLPPGARPPEVVGGGTGMSKHARTRSQTAVVEDATQPVPLPPSVLPPPVITADDEDSPASSEPVRRRFWFGRGGGAGSDSQDDGSSGVTGAGAGGKTSLWPFGKRRRGSEADLDFGVGDEDGGKSSGFVVTRRGRVGQQLVMEVVVMPKVRKVQHPHHRFLLSASLDLVLETVIDDNLLLHRE
ncbi:membrane protein [Ceratobasidium sp. AG-Ba]|nr:membrane protein [Ceratobasidium sp. AG-Ba]